MGDAAVGDDYTASATVFNIAAGAQFAVMTLDIIDDSLVENVEMLTISINSISDESISSNNLTILIEDNDFYVPTDITGMILHLSAGSGVTADPVTSNLTSWVDKTSAHTIAPDAGSSVKFIAETPYLSLPGVQFDEANGFLVVPNHADLNTNTEYAQKTILMVFHTSEDVTTHQVIYEQGGGSRGLSLYITEGLLYQCAWNNVSEGGFSAWSPQCVTSPAIKNSIHFAALRFDQPGNEMAAFVGFTKVDSITAPGKIFGHSGAIGLGDTKDNSLYHNLDQSAGHPFKGYLYEYITYNNALSDLDIAGVYNSLNPTYEFNNVKSFGISTAALEITEGDGAEFEISVTSPASTDTTFNISISGEVENTEVSFPATVTLPSGQLSKKFHVATIVDEQFELIESLEIHISSAPEVNIHTDHVKVFVSDDNGTLLSNMTAWYKPESIESTSSWKNTLSNDHHITSAVASTATITDLAGHQAIGFAGDGILTIANHAEFNTAASTSKFFILAFETGGDVTTPQVVYEEGGGSNGINLYIKDDKVVGSFWWKSGGVLRYFHETSVLPNTKYVALFYYDSVSDRFLLNVNRQLVGSLSVGSSPLPSHAGKIALGAMYNDTYFETAVTGNGHYFLGKISEFMYFNNPSKTDAQINTMVDYFNDKYLISP